MEVPHGYYIQVMWDDGTGDGLKKVGYILPIGEFDSVMESACIVIGGQIDGVVQRHQKRLKG